MSLPAAQWILGALALYGGLGLVFAAAFVSRGLAAVDPNAQHMPWLARLLMVPGVAALWPLMLWKWANRSGPPEA